MQLNFKNIGIHNCWQAHCPNVYVMSHFTSVCVCVDSYYSKTLLLALFSVERGTLSEYLVLRFWRANRNIRRCSKQHRQTPVFQQRYSTSRLVGLSPAQRQRPTALRPRERLGYPCCTHSPTLCPLFYLSTSGVIDELCTPLRTLCSGPACFASPSEGW